ncbi:MAG: carbamoyltransferase HypF [Candidatus Omnitrophica bacterium]|nr:carbamoyltransferase HypF [Candidatus Omnitrophota bacterium]
MGQQAIVAVCIEIKGAVQGVGFRPFVYRLSQRLGLKGFVRNTSAGVVISVEGLQNSIDQFCNQLKEQAPRQAVVQTMTCVSVEPQGFVEFIISKSQPGSIPTAIALPDLATCAQCRAEIFDPSNRRFRYPFTNCTQCGPRYSIIKRLPYDRVNTSMKHFVMCADCQCEFDDPKNRRFHAQPNACPQCGPHLELWTTEGRVLGKTQKALERAVDILRQGKILALKGLGGFQLLVDAGNDSAVRRLRQRKHREQKPLAVLFPSIEMIASHCVVSQMEEDLLRSAQAPIVLLAKRCASQNSPALALSIAPSNPYLGAMLPYTPLHYLLLAALGLPVVATSGNISDEPLCTDEHEAVKRLSAIADFFLVHNRPIVRPLDDSVARLIKGQVSVSRRARGYAPLPIAIADQETSILGVGGHYKSAIALKVKGNVFVGQHIGDLQTSESVRVFEKAVNDLTDFYAPPVVSYAGDLHPDYFSTRFAQNSCQEYLAVQHHHAHIAAVMAEHDLDEEVLGLAWDGTGLGDDRTIWGGEFLLCTRRDYRRYGHVRTFRLPGGDAAVRQCCKTALGLIFELSAGQWEAYCDLPCFAQFSSQEIKVLAQMLNSGINSPLTSSMGRLFDAVSALTGICLQSSFEGQAAMMLEFALSAELGEEYYPYVLTEQKTSDGIVWIFDWENMMRAIIDDVRARVRPGLISLKFHNTLVELSVAMALRVRCPTVVLGGGCFQNKYLLEQIIERLQKKGFAVYWPQRIPVNDGGLALGQVVVASARLQERAWDQTGLGYNKPS